MAVDFRPDGTVAIPVDGTSVVLRPPTLGELFDIWSAYDVLIGSATDPADGPDAALRYLLHVGEWVGRAFRTVADDVDMGPDAAWYASPPLATRLLGHWQTVPLGPWKAPGEAPDPTSATVSYDGPPLPGAAHTAFWSLWHELAVAGCPLPAARGLTVFEAAAVLGVARKVTPAAVSPSAGAGGPGLDAIRMRVRAAEEGRRLTEDDARATSEADVAQFMAALGG